MKIPIFSKRHKNALKNGDIQLSLDSSVKQRILYAIDKNDVQTCHSDISGYFRDSTLMYDVGQELCEEYGWTSLKSFLPKKTEMQQVDITNFIKYGAPQYIYDIIELFSKGLGDGGDSYQRQINSIFEDMRLPWRLCDDIIFWIDSEYFAEILSCTSTLLSNCGFDGALQEFQVCRSHYESGDFKGTIHHANQSLESTMKSVLGLEKEKPGKLIRMIIDSGIVPSYYDEFLSNFEQVLRSVNVARNEEAGHGQGAKIKDVPPALAELVVNICGSLIIYLLRHHMEKEPVKESKTEGIEEISDDDIPF